MNMKMRAFALSCLMISLMQKQALAQACPWLTKVTLNAFSAWQIGMAAFQPAGDPNTHLYISFAGHDVYTLNSMISDDGVNWGNLVTLPQMGLAPLGVGMTASPPCNNLYVAWKDFNNNMFAMKSNNGLGWDGPYFLFGPAFSTPTLRGDNPALPVGIAYSAPGYVGLPYSPVTRTFACDFTNLSNPDYSPFEFNSEQIPNVPLWTGANGTTDLKADATGIDGQIKYWVNGVFLGIIPGAWSDEGVGGAVNPADGTPYISWSVGSTLMTHDINIYNVRTGALLSCSTDYSTAPPTLAFFQGRLWVAWPGWGNDLVNVASLAPF